MELVYEVLGLFSFYDREAIEFVLQLLNQIPESQQTQ